MQEGSKVKFTFGNVTKEFTIGTINMGSQNGSGGGMIGGMMPYSEAAAYAGGYPSNSVGGIGSMTGMGGYPGSGMDQYGQYIDKTMLYNTVLQDSMFIESMGRNIVWDCIVYVNPLTR